MENTRIELQSIDIIKDLAPQQDALYYANVEGEGFDFLGFHNGDRLLVDRVKGYTHKCVVMLLGKEGFTLRQVESIEGAFHIMPLENEIFIPIKITPEIERSRMWGVVSFVVKRI